MKESGHRHKAVDLVGHIATAVGALHEDDADQVFGRVHPPIGAIGAALDETTDRVIAERAKHLAHHLETEAVTHSGAKPAFMEPVCDEVIASTAAAERMRCPFSVPLSSNIWWNRAMSPAVLKRPPSGAGNFGCGIGTRFSPSAS